MATSRVLTLIGQALAYVAPHAFRMIAIMTSEDSATFASWPTFTAGTGVPDEAQPNGSVYMRINGTAATWYLRTGGAWVLQTNATAALAALAALTPAADKFPYFTSETAAALADLTAFGRSIVAAADAAAVRVLLGLEVAASVTFAQVTAAFVGNLTGNVTGNVSGSSGSCTGNAATATTASSLAASAAFTSTEQTGTGASQDVAHGLGSAPRVAWWAFSDIGPGLMAGPPPACTAVPGVHDATNVKITVTNGVKFYVFALK